jgi:hypothetical protein
VLEYIPVSASFSKLAAQANHSKAASRRGITSSAVASAGLFPAEMSSPRSGSATLPLSVTTAALPLVVVVVVVVVGVVVSGV